MNKLTKLLSVFVIAGAIGTGIAGVAGCKTTSDGHKHEYTYEQIAGNAEKHNKTCTAEGHKGDVTTEEKHHFEGDKCKECEYPAPEIADTVSVKLKCDISAVKAGRTIDLIAVVAGPAGTSQKITWTIDYGDDVVQIVDGSKLKALKFGDFAIKATPEADATKAAIFDGHVVKVSKYDELSASDDCVVDSEKLLKTDAATLPEPAVGTAGVYDYDGSSNAKIESGVASATGGIYVDFGTTKDVIEGNVVLNIDKEGGTGYTLFRLATTGAKEIFGIKTNGKYRWNGGGTETNFTGNNYTKGSDYEVTFKYNKVTNQLTVNLGTDQSVVVYDGTAGFTGDVTGFSIHTKANSADNLILLKKVAIATYDLAGADYVNVIKEAVTSLNADAVALKDKDKGWTATGTESALSAAKTAADTALVSTATKEVADGALATYKTAVLSALSNEYLEQLKAAYPAANYNTGAGSAYDTAIAAAKTALDAVTEVSGFKAVYTAQDTEMKKVPDKTAETQEAVVLELYVNDNGTETKIGTVNKNIDGGELRVGNTVKLVDLKTACTTAAGKCVGKIYTNAERTTELVVKKMAELQEPAGEGEEAKPEDTTLVYVAAAGTDGVIKLYVTLGDEVSTSIDAALTAGMTLSGSADKITEASDTKFSAAGTLEIGNGITGVFEANKARVKAAALGGYTAGYDIGGKSKASAQHVKIELTQACTITIKFASGKSGAAHSLAICKDPKDIAAINDETATADTALGLGVLAYAKSTNTDDLATVTYAFAPEAGAETTTLYLCGSDSILIYDIIIGYEGAAPTV